MDECFCFTLQKCQGTMINKNPEMIRKMNEYGRNRWPFLFVIDFECSDPIFIPLKEAARLGIYYDIDGKRNFEERDFEDEALSFEKFPLSFKEYKTSFDRVLSEIKMGNTYLINLTFQTAVKCNLNLETIFRRTSARYKLLYKDRFVVFSPEIFVRIEDGKIRSFPMKGTIDAAIPGARDIIINDPKETAEHNTIVDLIRNDLSIVAHNIKVEKFRYVEEIFTNFKSLLQVSSEISGELSPDYQDHLGDIIDALMPAGSVTGAPKKKTVEIINDIENYVRGYYTGIFGIFDGAKLDSGVMIRFLENSKDGMIFKSGGGITFLSEAENEYQELIDKIYVPFV